MNFVDKLIQIYKHNVEIAKDYLNEKELKDLNRIVTMHLDYAEMIKEVKSKEERFEILSQIAKYQLNILKNAEKIKLLGDSKEYEENNR